MNDKEQKKDKENSVISPLAQDKTYGERVYDSVFKVGINFWLNLTVSGLFTYWVTHSHKPMKIFGKEFEAPSAIQQKFAKWVHGKSIMNVFGAKTEYDMVAPPDTVRGRAANNAANVFTLVLPGHPILILSSWLGAKIKSPFVEWLNRRHYGDEAMQDASLEARHAALRVEERPTLFGAIVGRIGTIFATQATVYSIGNPTNLVTWIGNKTNIGFMKNFHGMDSIAEALGNRAGHAIEDLAPHQTQKMDAHLGNKSGFGWSKKQIQENPALANTPYARSAQHIGKYLAQDVLYTAVTASTINPAINWLKNYIPGMTYTPKTNSAQVAGVAGHIAQNDNHRADNDAGTPSSRIAAREHHATLSEHTQEPLVDGGRA